jgi:protein TonB
MVRAPAHALSRSTGFALLQPAEKPHLDSARILTMSGTIAINLLAFGLLMMPLSMPPPALVTEPRDRTVLREIPKEPEVVEIVPTQPSRPTATPERITPRVAASRPSEVTSTPVTVDSGTEVAIDTSTDTSGPVESIVPASTGPAPMQLQYQLAPAPAYPRRALQQRLTGTVMLQVLVGIDGRPLDVSVAQSSGHRDLDEAARAQVLKRWSFQPATRNGQPVQAIGMVPIQFALKD